MVKERQKFPKKYFNELVIADFKTFQIAVPTRSNPVKKRIFSTWITVPQRKYATHGWLVWQQKVGAFLQGLKLGPVVLPQAQVELPFQVARRLSTSIPISFQTKASCVLPEVIAAQAAFTYQWPGEMFPYRAAFHQIAPRFARIYPFLGNGALLATVETMLHDEALFISQNYERLKHNPFYQENFDLSPVKTVYRLSTFLQGWKPFFSPYKAGERSG